MSNGRSTILYLFSILIILISISLYVFKDNISEKLLSSNTDNAGYVPASSPSNSTINLDILRDSRVKALKNYVSVFDYTNLDKSQDTILAALKVQQEVIITNPEEVGTSSESQVIPKDSFFRVSVGNSNPFLVNKVVK